MHRRGRGLDGRRRTTPPTGHAGQTIIFIVFMVLILTFVVIWNFDLHKILHVKFISQNGGDAAALAAARWQGISLNLVGDLNVMKAVALANDRQGVADDISDIQARLCFVGPMIALVDSQQAAKNNGLFNNDAYTEHLRQHADRVRYDYPFATTPGGDPIFEEPYDNCWREYSDMLYLVAEDGLAAGPDNARFYDDYGGGHILLEKDFYDAVAGKLWCWFFKRSDNLLEDYSDYTWWPDLPDRAENRAPVNAEFFRLGLRRVSTIGSIASIQQMNGLQMERRLGSTWLQNSVASIASTWYFYDSTWGPWSSMDISGAYGFPGAGPIKEQYDYGGADAAIRVEVQADRLTPGSDPSDIAWTSAAKPFGYLNDTDRPNEYDIVLPAFHEIALIPTDASSAPAGGSYDLAWRAHTDDHLPNYMERGLSGASGGCHYCNQLIAWENPGLRLEGTMWLANNSSDCISQGGGGGPGGGGPARRSGGRRRAH